MPLYVHTHSMAGKSRRGFSLIELIVVIGIIMLLAGITLSVSGGVMARQTITKAKGEMQTIAQALERYKQRYHEYPARENTASLTAALYGDEGNPPKILIPKRSGTSVSMVAVEAEPLLGSEMDYKEVSGDTVLVDPWGNPYEYYYADTSDIAQIPSDRSWKYPGFILYSKGPDGVGSLSGAISGGTSSDMTDAVDTHLENNADDIIFGFEN